MRHVGRRRRGGAFVVEALQELGIRHVFSVPGMQMLPVWDALPGSGIRLVVPRSEQDAAFLAEGYGHAASRPAVVMNTLGPGVANEILAMESARRSQAPVLFVSPSHPPEKRKRLGAVFQGFDQERFLAGFAKATYVVDESGGMAPALGAACAQCASPPRGPVRVAISFPLLFERHAFGSPPTGERREASDSRAPIFVYETPRNDATPPPWVELRIESCRVLWPGRGRRGHGVPFALGAKLAQQQAATIAFTSADLLIENAASLSLARFHGLEVRIVDAADPPEPKLRRLAALFRAHHRHTPKRSELQEVVFERPDALTIVCGAPLQSDESARPEG